jgi:DNA-binding HxlR family transcriptional regulator
MSKIQEKTYRCGMELTMDIIGGKWKGVILGICEIKLFDLVN